jgi:hypothetical protein
MEISAHSKKEKPSIELNRIKRDIRRIKNLKDLHLIFHSLLVTIDEFKAGTMTLREQINSTRSKSFTDF